MKIIKKMFGLDKLEASIAQAEQDLLEANIRLAAAEAASKIALEAEETAKLSPKERATRRKEAWVGVINTHVNKDNIRNGFFELDWNDQFVLQLKQEGYGEDGDKEEEIVDRWFRELCANVVVDGDFGGPVNTGVIDIKTVKKTNQ
jgi:regulator of protease activity HflC (stomatin/prohibitin superfamily)